MSGGAFEREIATAIGLHSRGALAEAGAAYRRLIAQGVKVGAVHSNLAAIYLQTGRAAESIELLKKAITLEPRLADAHYNLGHALQSCGRNGEAVAAYRQALALNPQFATAHINMGIIAFGQGAIAEAIAHYRDGLKFIPGSFEAHANLAIALDRSGDMAAAIASYRRAAEIRTDSFEAQMGLGAALDKTGDTAGAVAAFRRAAALRPQHAETYSVLGATLGKLLAWEEAATAFRRAADLEPTAARHIQLGRVYLELSLKGEAQAALETALTLDPTSHVAIWMLATLHHNDDRHDDARRLYERVLSISPHSLVALCGLLLIDTAEGRLDAAEQSLAALIAAIPGSTEEISWEALTTILYRSILREFPLTHYRKILQAADGQLQAFAGKFRHLVPQTQREYPVNRRTRIGYLSANLGNQPLGHVTNALFGCHDRSKFEAHVFLLRKDDSQYSRAIVQGAEHVHVLTHDFGADVRRIADQKLDVLIFLDGYMSVEGMRLMALRPAPVQVFWLGLGGCCDLSWIDYLIADGIVVPAGEEDRYLVNVVRLPHTFHCASPHEIGRDLTRSEAGLPEDDFVFCAFNNPEKIDRRVFDAWMRILKAVDGSVLWLSPGDTVRFRENIRREAAAAGVPAERIIFADRVADKKTHLARHRQCGLFLDTLTLTAATTALDALWAGLPVLTVRGGRFASRVATSLLEAVGLDDMVCATLADYEARAIYLAKNPGELAKLHKKLEDNRDTQPLFQIATFTRDFEGALQAIVDDVHKSSPQR